MPALRNALFAAGLLSLSPLLIGDVVAGRGADFDPLLDDGAGAICRSPALTSKPMLFAAKARTETAPFPPTAMQAAPGDVPLYGDLGKLSFKISSRNARAQAYFDQGLALAFGFNHAEAQRSFQAAQKLDPDCALCFWGEAYVLGPNINAPMMPEAQAPALAALAKAVALKSKASAKEQALIEALAKRYAAGDMPADRSPLDAAYADAMQALVARFPADDTIQTLFAEAAMDTQPWDYWEPGGVKPKGRTAALVKALETVLKRSPDHPGAIHLYIHAVEASTTPERALKPAQRLAALMPGAGHVVHMPSHIYYRVGQYRESLALNKKAVLVDEGYFKVSPSDPLYRSSYYAHNIHFVMVSAMMGGDGVTAIEAADKLDAAVALEVAQKFAALEPIKAARYQAHARFSTPAQILQLAAPHESLLLVRAMYHYARAVAFAQQKNAAATQAEIALLSQLGESGDHKPFEAFGVPSKEIVATAKLVAQGRLAEAQGDLPAAAKAYAEAIKIEDTLAYTEPPYWYYPVRQSLGGVRLAQGRLDDAETAFRDSLARVRSNGWALAGLVEVYRKMGKKTGSLKSAERAYAKAWFGPSGGPALDRL